MSAQVLEFLRAAGLMPSRCQPRMTPLAGGVSSDIWKIDLPAGAVCVKQALPRLRVAELWEAPVERNRTEYEWFRAAGAAVPEAVPRVIAQGGGVLVMEYLDPGRHPVWKDELRQGRADPAFARRVGAALAAIHGATAGREDIARTFATDAIFHAIRLEPYLAATARKHHDLQQVLFSLMNRTASTRLALVHGDVSPKNILVGPRGPVFLDAECAWYGDPAFDLAFCLNHLLLKTLWVPQAKARLLDCFDALAAQYLSQVAWEAPAELESRTATLLPALLLARIDGKSPVEYLTCEADRNFVRTRARELLLSASTTLKPIRDAWQGSST